MMMPWGNFGWGFGGFGMLFMLVFWGLILVGIVLVEAGAAHGLAEQARSAAAAAAHLDSEEDVPQVDGASCDGIRPTSTELCVSSADSRPTTADCLAGNGWQPASSS